MPVKYVLGYFIFVSLIATAITVYDKMISYKKSRRRISEKTLLYIAFFGGAIFEYITMLLIRHKTKHIKFMWGLPAIILFHAVLIIFLHLVVF